MRAKGGFTGLLRETSLETLAHLGPNAFEEISGEVVQCALFVTARRPPASAHTLTALRLVGLRDPEAKRAQLLRAATGQSLGFLTSQAQAAFLPIPDSPIVYWVRPRFIALLKSSVRLGSRVEFKEGLGTRNDERFLRYNWEVRDVCMSKEPQTTQGRWYRCAKGGGFKKWVGLDHFAVNWWGEGAYIKKSVAERYPYLNGKVEWLVKQDDIYFKNCVSYSRFARGSISARLLSDSLYNDTSISMFVYSDLQEDRLRVSGLLNSHTSSYLLRLLTPGLEFRIAYVAALPVSSGEDLLSGVIADTCIKIKTLIVMQDPLEATFRHNSLPREVGQPTTMTVHLLASILHSLEATNERIICQYYLLDANDVDAVTQETGTPAGWYPLITGYDALPPLLEGLVVPGELCEVLAAHLATVSRVGVGHDTAVSIPSILKARLRALYEAGPGAPTADDAADDAGGEDDAEIPVAGAYLPIPTETFLEELSQRLQIHPISVYWLLQEIRAEGARCKPEEQRLLEDRLSVLVLRLLGHRWPKQLEAGEPVPDWSDRDGIIPLLPGAGETTLAERLRERLRAEDGDLGAQQAETLLAELTGQDLETWLRRAFYPRHVRQFKYRPIAWHLASVPEAATGKGRGGKGKGGTRRTPAFECLVYYHACGVGMLAKIRTQYLEPLLRTERGREGAARQAKDDTTAAQCHALVAELEAFAARLRGVEEEGFACPELDAALTGEPLDRHCGDGILAPDSPDALLVRERAWAVDINDGVRVNVAPLQLAGALAAAVLKEPDARKAIADRARWRADERRWVREGVLPRCGWMGEAIPESPRWTERAPERAAEAAKLARKRAEALAKLEDGHDR